jgi:hypothetical protein
MLSLNEHLIYFKELCYFINKAFKYLDDTNKIGVILFTLNVIINEIVEL